MHRRLIQDITVYPKPVPDFSIAPKDGLYVDEAFFTFTHQTPGADHEHYWNFGDDITFIRDNNSFVGHQYSMYGTYNVMLKSVLGDQCADSIIKQVYVLPALPVCDFALFDVDGIEQDTVKGRHPLTANFEDRSLYAEEYFWDYGNDYEWM